MDIELNKQTFKALSNETRVTLLKQLGKRRFTQSELAHETRMSVPTVKEHLDELVKAGLVERVEEGRKWKYYALTKKGKGVLDPRDFRIWIILSLFVLSAFGSFMTYDREVARPVVMKMEMTREAAPAAMMADTAQTIAQPVSFSQPLVFYSFLVANIILGAILIILFVCRKKMFRQNP